MPVNNCVARRAFLKASLVSAFLNGRCHPALADDVLEKKAKFVGAQLYSISGAVQKDIYGTFSRLADLGCCGIELAGFHGHQVATIRAAAKQSGLGIWSMHAQAQIRISPSDPLLTEDIGPLIDSLHELRCTNVVMPLALLPQHSVPKPEEVTVQQIVRILENFTISDWNKTAEFLNIKGRIFKRNGISLSYHNHNMEFAPLQEDGSICGWDILTKNTDKNCVRLEMDVGWITAAGRDPVEMLKAYPQRIKMLHIKDLSLDSPVNFRGEQKSAPLGSGQVNWTSLMREARKQGIEAFFIEPEPPFYSDPFMEIGQGVNYIRELLS